MVPKSPDSPRFFVLEEGFVWSRYDVDADEVDPIHFGDAPLCPRCGHPVGMLTWLPPHRIELVLHGEEFGDFIECSGNDLLVSERFAQAFREEGLTGLEGFHPVEVAQVRRERPGPMPSSVPRYFVVTACFARAAVDVARSRILYCKAPTCEECRFEGINAVFGFTFEEGTWQGEDIFHPRGGQGVLTVSERFERFVARHGFNNLRMTPTEEYVWNPQGRPPPRGAAHPAGLAPGGSGASVSGGST
jgi:hypothetical protein